MPPALTQLPRMSHCLPDVISYYSPSAYSVHPPLTVHPVCCCSNIPDTLPPWDLAGTLFSKVSALLTPVSPRLCSTSTLSVRHIRPHYLILQPAFPSQHYFPYPVQFFLFSTVLVTLNTLHTLLIYNVYCVPPC